MRLLLNGTIAILLSVIACVAATTSCNKNPGQSAKGESGTKLHADVEYPEGWPIDSLTVPSAAHSNPLFACGAGFDGKLKAHVTSDDGSSTWAVGFATDLPWDEVVAHFDGIMKNLDYGVVHETPLQSVTGLLPKIKKDRSASKAYGNREGTTLVQLHYAVLSSAKINGYVLKVVKFANPQSYIKDAYTPIQ